MRPHYIIDSAGTLLGVALLIATGVHISGNAPTVVADDMALAAALLFLASCAASHWAITRGNDWYERVIADRLFALGLLVLFGGVVSLWF